MSVAVAARVSTVSTSKSVLLFCLAASFIAQTGCSSGGASSPVSHQAAQAPQSIEKTESPSVPVPTDPTWPIIYRDYGPLIAVAGEWERGSDIRPWSAWWYPLKDPYFFSSAQPGQSPLEKYDAYVHRVHQVRSTAGEYEREKLFNPQAEGWEGLCHAWAIAALLIPEPTQEVVRGGIHFSVADQKALLVKTFEEFVTPYYGQPYPSVANSEWSNIQPHLFHRFAFSELIERGRPFVMNKTPGVEVWNVPVWKMQTEVSHDGIDPAVYHVKTRLVAAATSDRPMDTPGTAVEVLVYTYDLFTEKDAQGRDLVFAGRWTGISEDMHPSVLIPLPEAKVLHSSRNVEIRNEWVDEILRSQSMN